MMQQRLYFLEACDSHLPVALWADEGMDEVDPLDQPAPVSPEPFRRAIRVEDAG